MNKFVFPPTKISTIVNMKKLLKLTKKVQPNYYKVIVNAEFILEHSQQVTNKHVALFIQLQAGKELNDDVIDIAFHAKYMDKSKNYNATGEYTVVSKDQVMKAEAEDKAVKIPHFGLGLTYNKYYNYSLEFTDMNREQGNCIVNYICNYRSTYIKVVKEFELAGVDINNGITINDILEWKRVNNLPVSIHVFNPFMKLLHRDVYKDKKDVISLIFISNNNHCYGITDLTLKSSLCQSTSLKYTVNRHKQFTYVSLDDLESQLELIISGTHPANALLIAQEPARNVISETQIKRSWYRNESIDDKKQYHYYTIAPLEYIVCEILQRYRQMPYGLRIDSSYSLVEFYHPISGQCISSTSEYELRESIRKLLEKELDCYHPFTVSNRTWNQLAVGLYEHYVGKQLTLSEYTKKEQFINTQYSTKPLTSCNTNLSQFHPKLETVDYSKCYLYAVLDNETEDYPVFAILDMLEPYDPKDPIVFGEYLVAEHTVRIKNHTIRQETQIESYAYVLEALKRGYITRKDILQVRKASYRLNAKQISRFASQVLDLLTDKLGDSELALKITRNLIINWIGGCGKNQSSTIHSAITDSEALVEVWRDLYSLKGTFTEYRDSVKVLDSCEFTSTKLDSLDGMESFFIMNQRNITRDTQDNAPIMRQVYGKAKLMVLQMISDISTPDTVIRTIRTDGVSGINFYRVPNPRYTYGKGVCEFTKEITTIRPKPPIPRTIQEFTSIPDIHCENDYMRINGEKVTKEQGLQVLHSLAGKSYYMGGYGGTQKSTIAKMLVTQVYGVGEVVVVSLAHRSASQWKQELGAEYSSKIDVCAGYLKNKKRYPKALIVEECSQIGIQWYRTIQDMKDHGVAVIMCGDFNQTPQVNDENHYFDMLNKRFFRELVDNNMMMKRYIPTCCRNDPRIVNLLDTMIEAGNVKDEYIEILAPMNDETPINITSLNTTKDRINKEWADKLGPWNEGRYVSCIQNDKKAGVFNGLRYKIQSIDNETVTVVDENGDQITAKRACFDEGYADTVYRFQGQKIDEPANIHDTLETVTTRNHMVTAIGRFTNFDFIQIDQVKDYYEWQQESPNATKIKIHDGQIGFIYRMFSTADNKEYIGKTLRPVVERIKEHWNTDNDPAKELKEYEIVCKVLCFDVKKNTNGVYSQTLSDIEKEFINKSEFFSTRQNVNELKDEQEATKTVKQLVLAKNLGTVEIVKSMEMNGKNPRTRYTIKNGQYFQGKQKRSDSLGYAKKYVADELAKLNITDYNLVVTDSKAIALKGL